MKYTRLYAGTDGLSHFEDVEIPLSAGQGGQRLSEVAGATGVGFMEAGADYKQSWHNAPRRQFVVTLQGEVEIVASDGITRRFGPGAVILAEDMTGKGHTSRTVGNCPRKIMIVALDKDALRR